MYFSYEIFNHFLQLKKICVYCMDKVSLCKLYFLLDSTDTLYISMCVRKQTNDFGFRPGPTQTELYSHRKWLKVVNSGFRK